MGLIYKLKDAVRFSISNWYNILILGLILFLVDHIIDVDVSPILGFYGQILVVILIIALSFMEIGYGFRIVEGTVHGSRNPPSFHHPLNLVAHGVKESVILLTYFIIPLILLIVGIAQIDTYIDLDLNPILVDITLVLGVIFFLICNILFQGAVLNMAHHDGSLRSGFNMIKVFRKIKLVGLKDMLLISIITIMVVYMLKQAIFDTLHGLPYVGDILATVIVGPFFILFTTRLLGLFDVSEEDITKEDNETS